MLGTDAEGPHRRLALWVQGCTLRCPGCCNPELFASRGGRLLDTAGAARLLESARDQHLEGITLLGGEPLDQPTAIGDLASRAQAYGLGVILFSGYRLAEIRREPTQYGVLRHVDTLVDGRFETGQPEPASGRRIVGSRNQTLHHFTPRYADPALWTGGVVAEIRVDATGRVEVHGDARTVARTSRTIGRPGP